ncbi:TPA: glycosyltransferase [Enterobacter cloacae]|nr:glycosyltransferase [Enterobacter pasteurii]
MPTSTMLRQLVAVHAKAFHSLLKFGHPPAECISDARKILGIQHVDEFVEHNDSLLAKQFDFLLVQAGRESLELLKTWLDKVPARSDLLLCGANEDRFAQAAYWLGRKGYRCVCQSANGNDFYFTVLPGSRQHIVMTATADNYHFANPLIDLARQEGHLVTPLSLNGLTVEMLQGWLQHCDVAWFEWGDSAAIAASRLQKTCRMVCRIHRYELYDNAFLDANWHIFDEVIFVSEAMKRRFVTLLGDKLPPTLLLTVIGNLTNHQPVATLPKAKRDPFQIGCVTRFVGAKNLFQLIHVMQMLIKRDTRYRLAIVGRVEDRCLYESFKEILEQTGMAKYVRIESPLPANKMAQWYSRKSYLLSTSYIESQGMAIFEAMLAGVKPVVFAATGGLQEYLPAEWCFTNLDEAVEQLLTPPASADFYAQRAVELLNQQSVASAYRQRWTPDAPMYRFTIIIPCYNRQEMIVSAIASALNVDYPHFDVLVVDDGSSDDTLACIADTFDDPRLRAIAKTHTNAPDTRNLGIQHAKGEFIVWLDSDDILHRSTLRHYDALLRRWPTSDIISCGISQFGSTQKRFYRNEQALPPANLLSQIVWGCPITNPGCCVRKTVYDTVGGYDEHFLRAHDYEFWSRALGSANVLFTARNNVQYRLHGNNLTGMGGPVDQTYEYRIFTRIIARYPVSLLFPGISSGQAKKIIAQLHEQREKLCGLENLAIVIPAMGEQLEKLDSAFLALGKQQDRAFTTWVVSDHDLSFLSVPTLRHERYDPQAIVRELTAQCPTCFSYVYALQPDETLTSDAISQLKLHILTKTHALPTGFICLRTAPQVFQ